jgi:hypothetical protein
VTFARPGLERAFVLVEQRIEVESTRRNALKIGTFWHPSSMTRALEHIEAKIYEAAD